MTNPNVIDMALRVQAAIASDAAVEAFCIEKYGRGQTVYVGMDDMAPPKKEEYPIVALHSFFSSGGGSSNSNIIYEIGIGCGITNKAIDYDADQKTKFYRGLIESEALRAAVFAAIFAGRFGKITIKDGEVGQTMAFPLFVAGMTVVIEVQNIRQR